jgi:hypothetical protein
LFVSASLSQGPKGHRTLDQSEGAENTYQIEGRVTLYEKVDSIEEATLSQGVHDAKKEEDEKTFHGIVQSRDREAGEAKRSSMPRAIEVGES